jgi:hypothetical protein
MTGVKVSRGLYTYNLLGNPATEDLDMDAFDITDVDDIIFTNAGQELRVDTSGLHIRVPTGDVVEVLINAILEYTFNATELNFNATNNVSNFADLVSAITDVEIRSNSGGWDIRVATGDDIDLIFNNVINYSFDENEFFMGANYIRALERSDPAAPAANTGLLYVRDNGSGKTQWVARFPTGAVQVVATEP